MEADIFDKGDLWIFAKNRVERNALEKLVENNKGNRFIMKFFPYAEGRIYFEIIKDDQNQNI